MNGALRTTIGYVDCNGITLVYVKEQADHYDVMVRTTNSTTYQYANEVAARVFGAVYEWEE